MRNAMLASLGLFFPFTAVLHHAGFYRPTCILNPFGRDYTFEVVSLWLSNDPSPYLGVLAAVITFATLRRFPWLLPYAVAIFFSFLPLSIWIWDIPFSGRIICEMFHDQRGPIAIYSRYFYILGAACFAMAALAIRFHRQTPQAVS